MEGDGGGAEERGGKSRCWQGLEVEEVLGEGRTRRGRGKVNDWPAKHFDEKWVDTMWYDDRKIRAIFLLFLFPQLNDLYEEKMVLTTAHMAHGILEQGPHTHLDGTLPHIATALVCSILRLGRGLQDSTLEGWEPLEDEHTHRNLAQNHATDSFGFLEHCTAVPMTSTQMLEMI